LAPIFTKKWYWKYLSLRGRYFFDIEIDWQRVKDYIEEERRQTKEYHDAVEWMVEGRRKEEKRLEDQAWYRKMDYDARMQRVLLLNIMMNLYQNS
jgi:hypothetical protein